MIIIIVGGGSGVVDVGVVMARHEIVTWHGTSSLILT